MKITTFFALPVLAVVGALSLLSFSAMNSAYAAAPAIPETVLTVLKNNKDLSKFAELVGEADLKDFLSQKGGKLTVFAPSNAAMGKLPSDVLKRAKGQKDGLKNLVNYHIINGSVVYSGNIKGRRASPSTALGQMIDFDGTGADLKVGKGAIVTPDLKALNGVVHVVSVAMIPESLKDPKELEEAKQKEDEKMRAEQEKQMKNMEAVQEKTKETSKQSAAKVEEVKPVPSVAAPTAPVAPTVAATPDAKKEETKAGWKKWFGF